MSDRILTLSALLRLGVLAAVAGVPGRGALPVPAGMVWLKHHDRSLWPRLPCRRSMARRS